MLQEAFHAAVRDAEEAEPDEIVDTLTALTPESADLVWDEETGRILMATWTSWDGYDDVVGQDMELQREIWVTAVPQVQSFCQSYVADEVSLSLRLEQLLGLPPADGKDRFVEVWVNPDDIFRPSPDPEIDDTVAELELGTADEFDSEEDYEFHRDWYNFQVSLSYDEENGYPWTRLGYTYDWGNPESEVGLSEFVVQAGAMIGVNQVHANADYCGQ